MVLIADSGSTKTDWRLLKKRRVIRRWVSRGLNPTALSKEQIISELQDSFGGNFSQRKFNKLLFGKTGFALKKVKKIHFYGAGCFDKKNCQKVRRALQHFYPEATIRVKTDLLGAARAVCGKQPGVVCILGTGANSGLYNGRTVIDNIPPLGYIIADEGSGADLGKRLLRKYFFRQLPPKLEKALLTEYELDKPLVITEVYQTPGGNRFLGDFTKFIVEHQNHPVIQKLVIEGFDNYLLNQVLPYSEVRNLPIHFVGSVAFFLQDILRLRIHHFNLKMGQIIRHPIEELVNYHSI